MRASSLSERLRRAVTNDDLPSAKRVYARIQTQNGLPLMTFSDADNAGELDDGMKQIFSRTIRNEEVEPIEFSNAQAGPSSHHQPPSQLLQTADVLGDCLALSATQVSIARQSRLRERNREAVRAKSSLAIALEKGAGIEMMQWLLDMGHERGDFSRDIRGCTIVSLAAQYNRTDVIEACCIDAVAHAATLHHQRSLMYGFPYGFARPLAEEEDEEEEERLADGIHYDGPDPYIDTPEGALSPALTLVTAAASTPSRRPSPKPMQLAKRMHLRHQLREAGTTSSDHDHGPRSEAVHSTDAAADDGPAEDVVDHASIGGSSEMDDIVGVTIQRLLDCPDELGRTGLALASMKGHEDAARLLVDLGASLDLGDFEGNRPLHYASAFNQLILVQMLIEGGCTYLAKNNLGFTPADYAWSASLKSALEAFARGQFDSMRIRQRNQSHSSPSFTSGTSPGQNGNPSASARDSMDTTSKSGNASSAATPSIGGGVIGLFPTPLRDNTLPASPPQLKLSSQLRDIF